MLDTFTSATFSGLLGDEFVIHPGDGPPIGVSLTEVELVGEPYGDGRAPFAILFRGPGTPILPQRIYRMEHAALGSFELFIVPLAPDPAGASYEAVFT